MEVKKFDIKKHSKRIKRFFKETKEKFFDIYTDNAVWIMAPLLLMDVFVYIFGSNINYSNYLFISPILFTLTWSLLFIGISICFKKWICRIVYVLFILLFMSMFLVNNIYYSTMHTFFDFSLLEAAGEGSPYLWDAVKNCNKFVYVALFIIIIFFVIGYKRLPKNTNNDYKKLGKIFLIFLIMHIITPFTLGFANSKLTWSSWRNPKNIYNSFNDNNKSIRISGFYEYTLRNFYVTFIKSDADLKEEDLEFLNTAYQSEMSTKNKYTGTFKGKNLILIQLEGTDDWLLNKNDTPTLYKMMNEGINFTKHYSFYNGGGSTFNSEFAVNTGFVTPLSYTQNAYGFNKTEFPYTLAKLFKSEGYSVNAFHMNTGEYYSRTVNYKNWGYDNYYGLIDMHNYTDKAYELDREMILNEEYSDLMFNTESPFVDYIITYTGHTPFTNTKGACKILYEMDKEEEQKLLEPQAIPVIKEGDSSKVQGPGVQGKGVQSNEEQETDFVQMSEEECARRQNKETDYMIELLLEKLKEKELLDNTVIVVFTDHYLYTLSDKTILDQYKETSNNLINHTPWFIWSSKIKKNTVKEVTSQLNILPTVLNLYGFSYNTNNYIGSDALANNYKGLVFFNDYSWYDGNVYVESGEIKNNGKLSVDKLTEKNEFVNYQAKKNDLTLKTNYFKKIIETQK